jgi:hypothetical protein
MREECVESARLGNQARSYLSRDLALLAGELDGPIRGSNEKAKKVLGFEFMPWDESIKATGASLRQYGFLIEGA